jgi:hypothetical protein
MRSECRGRSSTGRRAFFRGSPSGVALERNRGRSKTGAVAPTYAIVRLRLAPHGFNAFSAAVVTFVDPVVGFWTLAVGGATIFPLTVALLGISGRRTALAPGNPLGGLAMQVAFTVPLSLPVAGAAALNQQGWFYPACLIIVGAH